MMKTKRNAKILVLVLSLVLVIGAAFAVMASAEDATKPVIFSKNIAYEGNFGIMYAVDATTVKEGTVTLNLYFAEPNAESTPDKVYTDSTVDTIKAGGVSYQAYTFQTAGVAAKDMTDVFYVQAVDSEGNKSEVVAYSVVEYMLERLYGGNDITAAQKEVYEAALVFGAKAQALLASSDPVKVTDCKYVTVAGGTVDGVAKKMVTAGTTVTPVGEGALAWTATDVDTGKVVITANAGEHITVNGNYTITPIYELTDPAVTGRGNGVYYSIANTFSGLTAKGMYDEGRISHYLPSEASVTYDEDGGIVKASTAINSYNSAFLMTKKATNDPRILFANKNISTTTTANDSYILEYDINPESLTAAGSSNTTFFYMWFSKSFTKGQTNNNLWHGANITISQDPSNTSLGKFFAFKGISETVPCELGKWYNIRVEIQNLRDTANCVITYYINNDKIGSYTTAGEACELDAVVFANAWGEANGKVWLDNLYFENVADSIIGDTTVAGSRGNGTYYAQSQKFELGTSGVSSLKTDAGWRSMLAGDADIAYGYEAGATYVNTTTPDGDAALSFGATATGDPVLIVPAESYHTDTYAFETDFRIDAGTYGSAEETIMTIAFNIKADTKYSILNLSILYNATTNKYYLSAGQSYGYGGEDDKTSVEINAGEWYNIGYTVANAKSGAATVNVTLNGESILSYGFEAKIDAAGNYHEPELYITSRWGCKDLVTYFDNFYFSAIDE